MFPSIQKWMSKNPKSSAAIAGLVGALLSAWSPTYAPQVLNFLSVIFGGG